MRGSQYGGRVAFIFYALMGSTSLKTILSSSGAVAFLIDCAVYRLWSQLRDLQYFETRETFSGGKKRFYLRLRQLIVPREL